MTKTILLTGGTGFIGSHTAVALCDAGYDVVVVDNLCNSKQSVVARMEKITGKTIRFYQGDVCNCDTLQNIFDTCNIDAVVHFAALKSVGESVQNPARYYENNIGGLEAVLGVMEQNSCYNMVFSSSATVYGVPEICPIDEDHPLCATNPYGETKIACEEILRALAGENNRWRIALLRYFNPIGGHPSGMLGEDPNGIPNNLAPYVAKVAMGELNTVGVFGDDYDTVDGTGVRDYIHVMDLAIGHVMALEKLYHLDCTPINLGTGTGYSVLQVIDAFSKAHGADIPYAIQSRRPGDIAMCYADVRRAKDILGWESMYTLDDMATHHLQWVKSP